MKIYNDLTEAKRDLKEKTGKVYVRYFVNRKEVEAGVWRTSEGEQLIYRSGLEIIAEKNEK